MSTIGERARRELHQRAEDTWGKEPADTLMAYLPPVGYADAATKSDVAVLRAGADAMEGRIVARMERRFAEVHEAIAEVHEAIAKVHEAIAKVHESMATQARWFVVALSGTVVAVSALPQVVDKLLGS